MVKIIGREEEISRLKYYANSDRAEFIAIYGRRRVGKTFLTNQVLGSQFVFTVTGVMNGKKETQFKAFTDAFDMYNYKVEKTPDDWIEAFRILRHFLIERMSKRKRNVVFIDELPCFDTQKSDFVDALGYFWNSWASLQDNLMLVVCGSATSWMIENIIDNHGGLHNRITHEIHLTQFSLGETADFISKKKFGWDKMSVLKTYMCLGGIPYYLSLLDPRFSLEQNIDLLYFNSKGELRLEFDRIFNTLFKTSEPYIKIVEALFENKEGLSRDEIAKSLKTDANGKLSTMLQNLVNCDIIRFCRIKQKKISERKGIYQLMDFYMNFYLKFVRGKTNDESFWTKNVNTPTINSWFGLAFEKVCMAHISQIKNALMLQAISTEYYSWRGKEPDENGKRRQIDLVIERADNLTSVCEIKFSNDKYLLDEEEMDNINERISAFQRETCTPGGFVPVIISPKGLKKSPQAMNIHWVVTLEELIKR